jgi:hypothetical protein
MKKPSLLSMVEKKPGSAPPAADVDQPAVVSAPPQGDDERIRVVVRLNIEAVEAIEDISKELRRETGRAVPIQRLMEEAVSDLLKKYQRSAVVLPAPAKRSR